MAYERQSPDYTQLVANIAAKYPKEWDLANKEKHGDRTDDFIKIFAYEANKVDFRIGLNGKRGNPFDLSKDAVAYKNNTVPDRLGACEVIDIMVGNGHKPAWQDVTIISTPENPDGVAGVWIQPENPNGAGNGDSGSTPGTGDIQSQIDYLKSQLANVIRVGDKLTLKTQEWNGQPGKFVTGDRDNGGRLIANRDGAGTWEKLTVGRED